MHVTRWKYPRNVPARRQLGRNRPERLPLNFTSLVVTLGTISLFQFHSPWKNAVHTLDPVNSHERHAQFLARFVQDIKQCEHICPVHVWSDGSQFV